MDINWLSSSIQQLFQLEGCAASTLLMSGELQGCGRNRSHRHFRCEAAAGKASDFTSKVPWQQRHVGAWSIASNSGLGSLETTAFYCMWIMWLFFEVIFSAADEVLTTSCQAYKKHIYIYMHIATSILGTSSWWSEQRTLRRWTLQHLWTLDADQNFCLPGAAVSGACRETGSPGTRQWDASDHIISHLYIYVYNVCVLCIASFVDFVLWVSWRMQAVGANRINYSTFSLQKQDQKKIQEFERQRSWCFAVQMDGRMYTIPSWDYWAYPSRSGCSNFSMQLEVLTVETPKILSRSRRVKEAFMPATRLKSESCCQALQTRAAWCIDANQCSLYQASNSA